MRKKESGQTLIAVLMVMIIALAVGLAVSQRIIVGFKRSGTSDSSARALAVAEAAVEKTLLFPSSTLDGYITNNNCGSNCQLTITGNDGVVASATVTLAYSGNSTATYSTLVLQDASFELDLTGYPNSRNVELCWDNAQSGPNPSLTSLYVYGASMPYSVTKNAYNSASTTFSSNGFSNSTPDLSYQNCYTITGQTSPRFVRVRALYNDVALHVIPKSGASLPIQGYLITSTGQVGNVKKTVKVVKSKPFLPSSYDFVLFSTSDSNSLSN